MTWRTATIAPDRLPLLLEQIRLEGGTVTSSRPEDDGVSVTWTLPDSSG